MNSPLSLEERVRAAVRATAAEIGPYDVPPPAFGTAGLDARGAGSGRRALAPRPPGGLVAGDGPAGTGPRRLRRPRRW